MLAWGKSGRIATRNAPDDRTWSSRSDGPDGDGAPEGLADTTGDGVAATGIALCCRSHRMPPSAMAMTRAAATGSPRPSKPGR